MWTSSGWPQCSVPYPSSWHTTVTDKPGIIKHMFLSPTTLPLMAVGISLIHHDLWQCLQLFLSSIYFLSSAIFCCFLQKFIKQHRYHSVEGWCDHESPEASFRMFLDHPSTQTRGGRFLSLSKLRLGWCLKLGCGWKTQTCNGTFFSRCSCFGFYAKL